MKITILFSLLILFSCAIHSEEQIKSINEPLLVNIMALSEVIDLNNLQKDIDKNLWVKIYKLPGSKINNCFPESHGICKYKYYLATSQLDDSPIINAYYLGELGEITNYKWVSTQEIDTAIIYITVSMFTKHALSYNKSLNNKETNYKLIARANKIQLNIIQ